MAADMLMMYIWNYSSIYTVIFSVIHPNTSFDQSICEKKCFNNNNNMSNDLYPPELYCCSSVCGYVN